MQKMHADREDRKAARDKNQQANIEFALHGWVTKERNQWRDDPQLNSRSRNAPVNAAIHDFGDIASLP
jgi:hypothetical protein